MSLCVPTGDNSDCRWLNLSATPFVCLRLMVIWAQGGDRCCREKCTRFRKRGELVQRACRDGLGLSLGVGGVWWVLFSVPRWCWRRGQHVHMIFSLRAASSVLPGRRTQWTQIWAQLDAVQPSLDLHEQQPPQKRPRISGRELIHAGFCTLFLNTGYFYLLSQF